MWSVGTTGTQQITGGLTTRVCRDQVEFWWDTNPNLPLIKEWNTIDSTRIVTTTGNLGDNPADEIAGNTGGAATWTARDCSTLPPTPTNGGDCVKANLDTPTMPVEGSFILNSNNGSFIKADGRTFIDYTMGHHADAGGAYTGPVDGAQQTYTISGDCGSIRMENPTTGNIDVIGVQEGTDADQALPNFLKILSSDKGVAFQFVPNDTGSLTTTIGNADCGTGATICVTTTPSRAEPLPQRATVQSQPRAHLRQVQRRPADEQDADPGLGRAARRAGELLGRPLDRRLRQQRERPWPG